MKTIPYLLSVLLFFCIAGANAQDKPSYMGRDVPYFRQAGPAQAGTVALYAPDGLHKLLRKHIQKVSQPKKLKGWRVQIFFGAGHGAAANARKAQAGFEEKYPGIEAYLVYQSPYFKIRVGNVRKANKSEALRIKKKIEDDYPNCWIVESDIVLRPEDEPAKPDENQEQAGKEEQNK